MIYVDNAMNRKLGRVGKEKPKKEKVAKPKKEKKEKVAKPKVVYVDNAMNRKLGRVGKEKVKKEEKKAEQTPADYVAQLRKDRKKAPKKEKVKKTLKSTKSGYNAKNETIRTKTYCGR